MKYTKRTSVHINLHHIEENLRRIHERMPEGTKACAVIKTDGYGHGAVEIARHIQQKVHFFAVATAPEALELRQAGIKLPILILGYSWEENYAELIENKVRMTIFKESDARILSRVACSLGQTAKIHIKVDTGMSRIGFEPNEESAQIVRRIRQLPGIDVEGIFTHFARADEENKDYTYEQLHLFRNFVRLVEKDEERIAIHHCANSAASLEMPDTWMDMVRIGISLYGIYPSDEVDHDSVSLLPALTWKSEIVYLKEVEMGSGISYNHTRILSGDRLVATIPVGYGDGYPRQLSNRGRVLIRGRLARILGRVCMDQMMVDVTEIPDVSEGDEVTLVGRDGEAAIRVEDLSELCGRFPYEFVCDISRRVPRLYDK